MWVALAFVLFSQIAAAGVRAEGPPPLVSAMSGEVDFAPDELKDDEDVNAGTRATGVSEEELLLGRNPIVVGEQVSKNNKVFMAIL